MNQKLTLSLEQSAIRKGKDFAARNGTSLSQVVETFFLLLDGTGGVVDDVPVSSKLQSLVGIGAGPYDEQDYRRHREAKHA